jgi:hypothetical protein
MNALEPLEPRQLMTVVVNAGGDTIAPDSTSASHAAKQNFGFFRQGTPGNARSITYTLFNYTDAPLHVTAVAIPVGFEITTGPAANQLLAPDGGEVDLVIRLNKNNPGHHQGNVVIHTDDGDFKFEIAGDVGAYAAAGPYNLGPVDGQVVRNGSLSYVRQTDFSGSAILDPGVEVYGFSLATASEVSLNLQKLATGDQFGMSMNVYRDANADGVLQVSEEQPVMPATEVEGFGGADNVTSSDADATLAAGHYLMACEPSGFAPDFGVDIDYRFTLNAGSLGAPAIQVRQAGNAPIADNDLTPSPADGTDFGSAPLGSLARRDFVIKNTGDAPLQLSPAAFLAGNDGFSIDAGLPATLAPGGTARLGLRLLTTDVGHKTAQVVIPTNAPGVGQFNFAVAGDVGPGNSNPAAAPTPPAATLLSAPKLTKAGGKAYAFTVRYTDADKIDLPSINKKDLTVTGPNGFSSGVKVASVTAAKKGRRVDVTYRLSAPGGEWNRADNGQYAVALRANQVADKQGTTAPAAALGAFKVKIPKGATPAIVLAPAPFSRTPVNEDDAPFWA